jgi:hypothetical protein
MDYIFQISDESRDFCGDRGESGILDLTRPGFAARPRVRLPDRQRLEIKQLNQKYVL